VYSTAWHPETGEHITIARRSKTAELPGGNDISNFAALSASLNPLSFTDPLTNDTSVTLGPGATLQDYLAVERSEVRITYFCAVGCTAILNS